jgi:hypothetical protein
VRKNEGSICYIGANILMYKRIMDINNVILYLLLALIAIDFRNVGIYILFLLTTFILISIRRKIAISNEFWILFVFAIFYFALGSLGHNHYGIGSVAIRAFAIPISYLLGLNMYHLTSIRQIEKVLIWLTLFMTIHVLLNMLYSQIILGNLVPGRYTFDIWSGAAAGATGQAAYLCFLVASIYYLIFLKKDIPTIALFGTLFALAFMYSFVLAGRAFFVLLVIALIIGLAVSYNGNKVGKQYKRGSLSVVVIVILLVIIFTFMFERNIGGLSEYVYSSNLYYRFFGDWRIGFFEDVRLARKFDYITMSLSYPFGGGYIKEHAGGYAHDLWLDTYNVAGVIPFLCLVAYTIRSIRRMIKLSFGHERNAYSVMFLSFYIIVNIQFFIEPIIEGNVLLLTSFCIIDGMATTYLASSVKSTLNSDMYNRYS